MRFDLQTAAQLSGHLRELRRRRGLSQTAIGQRLGVSQSRFARIENDPTSVSLVQLLELLHILGSRVVVETDDASEPETGPAPNTTHPVTQRNALDEPW